MPAGGGNLRRTDYRGCDGGMVFQMRADEDADVWTLVDACPGCARRRRRAGSEWCHACRQRSGNADDSPGVQPDALDSGPGLTAS